MRPHWSHRITSSAGALRMRSTSMAGSDRWQPLHDPPTRRAAPVPPESSAASRSGPGGRRGRWRRRPPGPALWVDDVGVDAHHRLGDGRPQPVTLGPQRLALGPGRLQLAVDRLQRLHDLDLVVLELGDPPLQMGDLLVHGLEIPGRRPPGPRTSASPTRSARPREASICSSSAACRTPSSSRPIWTSAARASRAASRASTPASSACSGRADFRCSNWPMAVSWSWTSSRWSKTLRAAPDPSSADAVCFLRHRPSPPWSIPGSWPEPSAVAGRGRRWPAPPAAAGPPRGPRAERRRPPPGPRPTRTTGPRDSRPAGGPGPRPGPGGGSAGRDGCGPLAASWTSRWMKRGPPSGWRSRRPVSSSDSR